MHSTYSDAPENLPYMTVMRDKERCVFQNSHWYLCIHTLKFSARVPHLYITRWSGNYTKVHQKRNRNYYIVSVTLHRVQDTSVFIISFIALKLVFSSVTLLRQFFFWQCQFLNINTVFAGFSSLNLQKKRKAFCYFYLRYNSTEEQIKQNAKVSCYCFKCERVTDWSKKEQNI